MTDDAYPIVSPMDDRSSSEGIDEWFASIPGPFPIGEPIDGLKVDPSLIVASDGQSTMPMRSVYEPPIHVPNAVIQLPSSRTVEKSETSWPSKMTKPQQKREKWYPPLLPAIIKRGDVVVHRASQNSRDGSERITVHMKSLEDGYKWRKYGQKSVKGNIYPRSYYKCTYPGCQCRKQVEKSPTEAGILLSTYEGLHCHPPCPKKPSVKSSTPNRKLHDEA